MIYESDKLLYLSISSGVVLRSKPEGEKMDSGMVNHQRPNSIIENSKLPSGGHEEIDYKFCGLFMTIPFGEHDSPPPELFLHRGKALRLSFIHGLLLLQECHHRTHRVL